MQVFLPLAAFISVVLTPVYLTKDQREFNIDEIEDNEAGISTPRPMFSTTVKTTTEKEMTTQHDSFGTGATMKTTSTATTIFTTSTTTKTTTVII